MSDNKPTSLEQTVCRNGHILEGHNRVVLPNRRTGCRTCRNINTAKWRATHKEQSRKARNEARERQKVTDPEYRAKNLMWSKQYRKRTPLKTKARRLFQKATFDGKITRLQNCERCESAIRVEAHHYDYNRAFDVIYLCKKCHELIHHALVGELI